MIATQNVADSVHVNRGRLEFLDKTLCGWVEDEVRTAVNAIVYRDGQKVFEGSYGSQGPDCGALKIDNIFHMASITKPFIATLLMMLQEDGIVDLHDPVKAYYHDFQCTGDEEEPIRIWHMLTHTSGLDGSGQYHAAVKMLTDMGLEEPKWDDDEQWQRVMLAARRKLALPEMEDAQKAAGDTWHYLEMHTPLTNAPRKVMSYCDMGYDICRRLIERVTGETIDGFARRKLFDPLGMADTHWVAPKEKWPRIVRRYENDVAYPWFNNSESYVSENGAGGLKMTAPDAIRFCEMIRRGGTLDGVRILSPSTVRCMSLNYNADMNPWDSWTIGFNYRGTKFDDTGIVRPATALDHSGHGGVKMLIDKENRLTWTLFCTYPNGGLNVFSRFANMVYSTLDD